MPDLREQVKNEGFCIIVLCRDLTAFINSGRTRKTYLLETEEFLKYIVKSLESIEKSIRNTIEQPIEEELLKSKLREFGLIKKVLSSLYVLTKETIDSDTLSMPYSLTILLNDLVKKIDKLDTTSLVVLSSSNLMYYKYNLDRLRNLTQSISTYVVKDYPVLPSNIGILKFPYCAAHNVLINCILFHELGHYIYEITNIEKNFIEKIENDLAELVIQEHILEKIKPIKPHIAWNKLSIYVKGLLTSWTNEIFADITAIRMLGPAFHLACLEMEHILPTEIEGNKDFSRTHPADNFRFKMHAKWLKEEKWDSIINKRTPEIFQRLEECKKLKIEDFKIKCQSPFGEKKEIEDILHKWMLVEFEKMVLKVEKEISEKISNTENPIDDFKKNDLLVTRYLSHGVVPSTVYDDKKNKYHPCPTTMLNSGFFFYMDGMRELIQKIKADISETEKRLKYEKRLNEWLEKAIEDWQILQLEK